MAVVAWKAGLRSRAAWMEDTEAIVARCEKAGLRRYPGLYMIEDVRLAFHLRGWRVPVAAEEQTRPLASLVDEVDRGLREQVVRGLGAR